MMYFSLKDPFKALQVTRSSIEARTLLIFFLLVALPIIQGLLFRVLIQYFIAQTGMESRLIETSHTNKYTQYSQVVIIKIPHTGDTDSLDVCG